MSRLRPTQTRPVPSTSRHEPNDLKTCKFVLLQAGPATKPLQRPYTGPYEVLKRQKHTFKIKTPSGIQDVAIHRLKPAHVDQDNIKYDVPRPRGRPPGSKNRRKQ
ncbi:hypothetical protein BLOT_004741 [Blomia tropicalis]|nr:hypothetical protein BLOT_004741 [Blomia tropicalis]